MWYWVMYVAIGLLVNMAMEALLARVYKGLNYEREYDEAFVTIVDDMLNPSGRWCIVGMILGLILSITLWPILLFVSYYIYIEHVNQIITDNQEDESCPNNED